MKTKRIIVLAVSVVLVLGLLLGVAYGTMALQPYQQATGTSGMMGGNGHGGSMMGTVSSHGEGMMAGARGSAGGRSGMMGGQGFTNRTNMMEAFTWSMPCFGHDERNGATSGVVVVMAGSGFHPANLSVPVGTTIMWVNMDFVQHTATSGVDGAPSGLFDSHELGHMQSFNYSFNAPGSYPYYCDLHPGMVGTVTVVR